MPRPIWNGSISFGLVQIPVGLYPAEQQDELSLTSSARDSTSPLYGCKRETGSFCSFFASLTS